MKHIGPADLVEARLELHYAAQILAACADAWIPARSDDSHTAMSWSSPLLVGERTAGGRALRLRCTDLTILAGDEHRVESFALAGKTLAEGLAWADARLGPSRGARMRDYEMPPSPLRSGGRFVLHEQELLALVHWYDKGLAVVGDMVARDPAASSIRVWPHHFDLGAILDGGVGIGLSPGDRYYGEPYFYVTPGRPLEATPTIDGGGFWRTDGWVGAVLLASAGGDPHAFMVSAIAACTAGR